ncbi:2-octaprenyl-6-methoxyphenol hydroxylase [Trinickia symbiotica]|uniref:2-octaprenyl-6-methoxyphenyl hydroxylase n=1 Tax=Trinickia symbiotica TaxID=863227 RepID=A0A2N7WZ45_9BURK|nr:UbiH/UbiF/VisC/COQ6 family ubiquinone biosynthesis hydroxylase [Trinickia symbiotica]PMS34505.1 2-octaprenyl-6-methoxyphenyl hydroxylase [Trinickia symbiotica]PPK43157.1 2-octaprenyl-6-methoxyphenol hydroxylase [Trinickia symbiotica]
MSDNAPLSPSKAVEDFDVTIVGAGPVGLALAAWLARRSASTALTVALVDAREPVDAAADPRAIAVSEGSRMLLEPLSAWPASAHAIERIHVSERGRFGRTLIERDEHGLPALGYVARYGAIVDALGETVRRTHTRWLTSASALTPHAEQGDDWITLPIESGRQHPTLHTLRTRVLVNAEGGLYGDVRAIGGAGTPVSREKDNGGATRDYGQTALVGTVTVSAPQPHTAWERFTAEGPIALLPVGGMRQADYALVWCMVPEQAERRLPLSDDALLAELGVAFGDRMGRFEAIKGRAAFPLGLTAAKTLARGRIVAIGNAAQTLHPVAGQGLNLGLRDAHALADALARHGATPRALADFARVRALDRRLTIGATDALARLFTVDMGPLSGLRGLALAALELVPPAKTALARQMMFGQRR